MRPRDLYRGSLSHDDVRPRPRRVPRCMVLKRIVGPLSTGHAVEAVDLPGRGQENSPNSRRTSTLLPRRWTMPSPRLCWSVTASAE